MSEVISTHLDSVKRILEARKCTAVVGCRTRTFHNALSVIITRRVKPEPSNRRAGHLGRRVSQKRTDHTDSCAFGHSGCGNDASKITITFTNRREQKHTEIHDLKVQQMTNTRMCKEKEGVQADEMQCWQTIGTKFYSTE